MTFAPAARDAPPSVSASRSGRRSIVPPRHNAPKISKTEMSNDSDVAAMTRPHGPGNIVRAQVSRFTTLRCSTIVPFG
jgi:hypothetical protein